MPLQAQALALFVDIDPVFLSVLQSIAEGLGTRAICQTDFTIARQQLRELAPDFLIANLRLASFNGIHLALLARLARPDTRALIYSAPHDPVLAREVHAAGAFYERRDSLARALPRFLPASLPAADRRNPSTVDRRTVFRGGRRGADDAVLRGVVAQ